jgi:hypothetical protein
VNRGDTVIATWSSSICRTSLTRASWVSIQKATAAAK